MNWTHDILYKHNILYKAVKAKDPRFDGLFFTAVKTTGIYCRNICPARTPRIENVEFFQEACQAEAAGYRPCLRCRPETAPGSPAWRGVSGSMARAVRLIEAGALTDGGLSVLAEKLGIGVRQLNRLFRDHFGVSPLQYWTAYRLRVARQLLRDTSLSMVQVALASGFGSIRRFNEAFRNVYGMAPGELRDRNGSDGTPEGRISFLLRYRPPFPWSRICDYFELRAIPGVESVVDGCYMRSISVGEGADRVSGVLIICDEPSLGAVKVTVPVSMAPHVLTLNPKVRRLLDLEMDPMQVAALFSNDPHLGFLKNVARGVRIPGAWDGFELAVRTIVGQQISVRAASTVTGRIAERFGRPLDEPHGSVRFLFPDAAALLHGDLSAIRLTAGRLGAIQALARAVDQGTIRFDGSQDHSDVASRLIQLPGIGEWTKEYLAMRILGDPDAFMCSDLGIRKALGKDGQPASARYVRDLAEAWRPFRSYANIALWWSQG